MNVWPVIVRELRQQARQRFTFTLRVVGLLLMTTAAVLYTLQYAFVPNYGGILFRSLHTTLFYAIWILIPLSASDCISRELREGTLGLLFLTPLRAREIVIAKAVAQGLRAMTLLLAVLPVLTIPFVIGGANWQQAVMSALVNFSAICWSLAAAMVASAGTRSSLRALVGTGVLTIVAIIVHTGTLEALTMGGGPFAIGMGVPNSNYYVGSSGNPPPFFTTGAAVRAIIATPLWGTFQSALIAVGALAMGVMLAAASVRRNWREEPPPVWVQQMQKTFCTPVLWQGHLKRWMRWKIQRNPVGWLEQRTWTGRLVTWAWFAIVISLYSAIVTDRNLYRGLNVLQMLVAWLMMGSIAASAAGSFRRERESGVLELLLVTPLTSRNIIRGRLWGIWGQFLPAIGGLLVMWLYLQSLFPALGRTSDLERIFFFAITFVTLPVIGLYFSLRSRSYVLSFLLTVVVGIILPLILERLMAYSASDYFLTRNRFDPSLDARVGATVFQIGIALCLGWATRKRLEARQFPLERTGQ